MNREQILQEIQIKTDILASIKKEAANQIKIAEEDLSSSKKEILVYDTLQYKLDNHVHWQNAKKTVEKHIILCRNNLLRDLINNEYTNTNGLAVDTIRAILKKNFGELK